MHLGHGPIPHDTTLSPSTDSRSREQRPDRRRARAAQRVHHLVRPAAGPRRRRAGRARRRARRHQRLGAAPRRAPRPARRAAARTPGRRRPPPRPRPARRAARRTRQRLAGRPCGSATGPGGAGRVGPACSRPRRPAGHGEDRALDRSGDSPACGRGRGAQQVGSCVPGRHDRPIVQPTARLMIISATMAPELPCADSTAARTSASTRAGPDVGRRRRDACHGQPDVRAGVGVRHGVHVHRVQRRCRVGHECGRPALPRRRTSPTASSAAIRPGRGTGPTLSTSSDGGVDDSTRPGPPLGYAGAVARDGHDQLGQVSGSELQWLACATSVARDRASATTCHGRRRRPTAAGTRTSRRVRVPAGGGNTQGLQACTSCIKAGKVSR